MRRISDKKEDKKNLFFAKQVDFVALILTDEHLHYPIQQLFNFAIFPSNFYKYIRQIPRG
jgi:hypothetical protein